MKNEGDVKKHVKHVLRVANLMHAPDKVWWFMPPANGFGRAGVPDFVGHVNGKAFCIETKFGNNKLTANQTREIDMFRSAGGKSWVVRETNIDDFEFEFYTWVRLC